MDLGLQGARILVTGGSRGIGRSIAAAFLREGSAVTICGRDEGNLARARAELGAGRVRDVVVANATAAAAGGSEPEYADSFAVDLMQSVRLAEELRAAQPELPFTMVCLGSVDGLTGATPHHAYSVMKAALLAWTKNAALAFAPDGILVNAVRPGAIWVADVMVFLASGRASWVTGATVLVDGGEHAATS